MMTTISMPSPKKCRKNSFLCEIFDPQSKIVNFCNYFLLFVGILSLYVDPLLFYLPVVNDSGAITMDWELAVSFSFLRSIGDTLLFLGIILRFRTGYEDRALHGPFGKGKVVNDSKIIAIKYLKSTFIVDLLASFPIPQVYLSHYSFGSRTLSALEIYNDLIWMFPIQFVPRACTTYLVQKKIEKATGIAIRSPWSGTLYILLVYGMLSHFVGAFYYYMYATELLLCRGTIPKQELDQLLAKCANNDENKGVVSEAFANNIGSRSFTQKYMFCFSWGLKTLSSMGQNLKSSALIADTFFNLSIIIAGLLLFADLIARMQTCMQSVDEIEEQQMVRQRELEEWTNFHHLPLCLKKRVQQTVQSHLPATRGLDDEAMLDSLPLHLRFDIRKHMYMERVRNLAIFREMDVQLSHTICGHLRTFSGAEGMYIVLEGDPVQQLLFIFSGQVELFSIDGGSSSCITVGPGGICGQELLTWLSLSGVSTHNLPPSACTVKCLTDVEAFSILAKDLKHLAIQFNYDKSFFDALSNHYSAISTVL